MLSASRRQPHLLHVSAVDLRQTWSMDKSWRCVTLSGFLHSHIVRCRWNPISCGTHYSGPGLSENDSAVNISEWLPRKTALSISVYLYIKHLRLSCKQRHGTRQHFQSHTWIPARVYNNGWQVSHTLTLTVWSKPSIWLSSSSRILCTSRSAVHNSVYRTHTLTCRSNIRSVPSFIQLARASGM